jgi:hypothetical protein
MELASSCFIIWCRFSILHACGASVSAGDGRRINDDINGTLYIAWALRVISPLERELFISAERQNFAVVCIGDMFS